MMLVMPLSLLLLGPVLADTGHGGMNEGGIVTAQTAVIYSSPRGTRPVVTLRRGDAVAASIERRGPDLFYFEEKYGRVRVVFFYPGEEKPLHDYGWIDAAALARFYYTRTCQPIGGPLMMRGARWEWNTCFTRARDEKLAELERA